MEKINNGSIVKKANVYFNGKVTSRTILLTTGEKKTLGIMMPGQYEFETGDQEHMELLAGELNVLLPNNKEWTIFKSGQTFDIPAHTKFRIRAVELSDYCCSYIAD